MLSPLYMAEISPPEVRGSLMALEQFSIVLGVVLGFWTGFWTRSSQFIFTRSNSGKILIRYVVDGSISWRLPLAIQLVPGMLLAIVCLFLPPSPRLLVLNGHHDEALQSLARLRLRTPDEAQSDPLLQVTVWRFLFSCSC